MFQNDDDRVQEVFLQVLQVNVGVFSQSWEEESEEDNGHHESCRRHNVEQYPHQADVQRRARRWYYLNTNHRPWDVIVVSPALNPLSYFPKHPCMAVHAGDFEQVLADPTHMMAIGQGEDVVCQGCKEVDDEVDVEQDVCPDSEVGSPGLRRGASKDADVAQPDHPVPHQQEAVEHVDCHRKAPLQK